MAFAFSDTDVRTLTVPLIRELEHSDAVRDAGVPRPTFLPREASLFPVDRSGDPDPKAKKPPPPEGLILFRF